MPDELNDIAKARVRSLGQARRTERRSCRRYPVELKVQFSFTSKGKILAEGSGTTRDIGIHGLAFRPRVDVPVDTVVEMRVAWPVQEGAEPITLKVIGRVVRIDNQATVIAIVRHTFSTPSSETEEQLDGDPGKRSGGEL